MVEGTQFITFWLIFMEWLFARDVNDNFSAIRQLKIRILQLELQCAQEYSFPLQTFMFCNQLTKLPFLLGPSCKASWAPAHQRTYNCNMSEEQKPRLSVHTKTSVTFKLPTQVMWSAKFQAWPNLLQNQNGYLGREPNLGCFCAAFKPADLRTRSVGSMAG